MENPTLVTLAEMGKGIAFEARAEPGFTTTICAVRGEAILAAGTAAVSFSELTNIVASAEPFQSTVAPGAKPVPVTARVNAEPPGAALGGRRG